MSRFKPSGPRITDIEQLKEGMSVMARYRERGRVARQPIRFGYVEVETAKSVFDYDRIYIRSRIDPTYSFYIGAVIAPYGNDFKYYDIYKLNRFKEKTTMANKLMALVRLNKNQRKLAKVGIYDENGNLTADGQEVLMNLVAKEYEVKLIDLVKDWKDVKKKKCDDGDEDDD